jgi:ribonuclease PH
VLAASVNAMLIGLMDAGIPLVDRLSAVNVVIPDKQGELLIDPCLAETKGVRSMHTLVFSRSSNRLISIESNGKFSVDEVSLFK